MVVARNTNQAMDAQCRGVDNVFEPSTAEDVVSTGTSTQSTVLSNTFVGVASGDGCIIVEIVSDGNLRYLLGENPTVTATTGSRLPDGAGKIIRVPIGFKIASISESGTTRLNITHMK